MSDLIQTQHDIISEFELFFDWSDRYQYIIDLGKELAPYPSEFQDEAHFVKGCQSQVWLYADKQADGTVTFYGTSDSAIVKGIIALLLRVYNHQPVESIQTTEPFFINEIGLEQHLSPNRRNGMHALLNRIRNVH